MMISGRGRWLSTRVEWRGADRRWCQKWRNKGEKLSIRNDNNMTNDTENYRKSTIHYCQTMLNKHFRQKQESTV